MAEQQEMVVVLQTVLVLASVIVNEIFLTCMVSSFSFPFQRNFPRTWHFGIWKQNEKANEYLISYHHDIMICNNFMEIVWQYQWNQKITIY